MAESAIEWTDFTVNPIRARWADRRHGNRSGHACEKVSPGCRFCYSSQQQHRFGLPRFDKAHEKYTNGEIELYLDEAVLQQVLRRRKPTRYFWCSMTDMFWRLVPDEWIDQCFAVMALTPQHVHMVLTKRAERMYEYVSALRFDSASRYVTRPGWTGTDRRDGDKVLLLEHAQDWPLPSVQLGVSVENQQYADERIPWLLKTPAAVRFVSAEPLLSAIDLSKWLRGHRPYDGSREGVSCISCGRSFLDRSARENMETPPPDRRESNRDTPVLERPATGSGGQIQVSRISDRDVFRRPNEAQGLCPSCRMDAHGTAGHTERDADQPQERNSGRYSADQPRTDDTIPKRDPRHSGSGPQAESPGGGNERHGETHGIGSSEDTGARRENAPIENRGNVQGEPGYDIGDSAGKDVDPPAISLIIAGGESGPNARPSHPDWFRRIRDQCEAAGTKFFMKQWGEFRPIGCADSATDDIQVAFLDANIERTVRVWPDGSVDSGEEYKPDGGAHFMEPAGKHAAGRLLDGRTHDELPQ